MEIQKIFSEIDTDERLYSVLMNEDELALFSEISVELEQREFNSKAAKALNTKYLRQYAIDHGISKDMLMMKKEPLNPQTIKKNARIDNRYRVEDNDRSSGIGASSVDPGRSRNRAIRNKNHPFRKEYDHGDEITINSVKSIVANNPWTGEIDRTRGELKRLRAAAKK